MTTSIQCTCYLIHVHDCGTFFRFSSEQYNGTQNFENDPFHGNPTVQSYSTKIQTFMRTLCKIQKQEGYLIIFIFGRSPIPFPSIVNYYLIMENDEFRALVYLIDPMQSELYNNSFSRHELEAVRTRRDNHYLLGRDYLSKMEKGCVRIK